MKARSELTEPGRILMWKAERMRRNRRKHNTGTDATKGTEKGRIVGKNVIEGWRMDGNGRRWMEMDGECSRTNST